MVEYRCARMPTREMFISFFREVYDREPSWVNPNSVLVPSSYTKERVQVKINDYGEIYDYEGYLYYEPSGYLKLRTKDQWLNTLSGFLYPTCDEYQLNLCIDATAILGCLCHFKAHSTSAHNHVFITHHGSLLIPVAAELKDNEETVSRDLYLEFLFEPDTSERLRRLYSDGLLIDYSIAEFTSSGLTTIRPERDEEERDLKRKKEEGTYGCNAFSTREIANGSAVSALLDMYVGS